MEDNNFISESLEFALKYRSVYLSSLFWQEIIQFLNKIPDGKAITMRIRNVSDINYYRSENFSTNITQYFCLYYTPYSLPAIPATRVLMFCFT